MELGAILLERLKEYGVGRRKLDNRLFVDDTPPHRLGVYDEDDEDLCHEVIISTCNVPGCKFTTESLLAFENHYNSSHRYACSQCKKVLPSPHLLDMHLQEVHDSFFAVMAEKKPSYCCFIEACKEKFMTSEERHTHCVKEHKVPKDFRYEQRLKSPKAKKPNEQKKKPDSMEVDGETSNKNISFKNSNQKFAYTGKKFTRNEKDKPKTHVNVDDIVGDLRESLPGLKGKFA